jgi:hypothetical protein
MMLKYVSNTHFGSPYTNALRSILAAVSEKSENNTILLKTQIQRLPSHLLPPQLQTNSNVNYFLSLSGTRYNKVAKEIESFLKTALANSTAPPTPEDRISE